MQNTYRRADSVKGAAMRSIVAPLLTAIVTSLIFVYFDGGWEWGIFWLYSAWLITLAILLVEGAVQLHNIDSAGLKRLGVVCGTLITGYALYTGVSRDGMAALFALHLAGVSLWLLVMYKWVINGFAKDTAMTKDGSRDS